jgi:hypothetical protein
MIAADASPAAARIVPDAPARHEPAAIDALAIDGVSHS